jgi:TRAP-type C4-dicarboxylate transport system permease small subunit
MEPKAANDIKEKPAKLYFSKTIDKYDHALAYISRYVAYFGAAVLGLLVLMLIYSIVARRAFNVPLKGSMELTELALCLITFFLLAYDSLKGESMVVEIITDRFPEQLRAVIGAIIHFLSTAILGVLSWQLVVQGLRVYGFHQTTVILSIPVFPFLYVAALGTFLLTLVYLKHFLYSLGKARRR